MYEMTRRAMLQLNYDDAWMADADAFGAAVDAVDLHAVTKKTMSNAVYACAAIEAFDHARYDYIYPHCLEQTYAIAGQGLSCFLHSETDPIRCARSAYFSEDAVCEILELMLIEDGRSNDETYDPDQPYFEGMGL